METKTNQAEPKSKKGLGMTLTEAIGELEKGYFICSLDMDKDAYLYLEDGKVMPKEGSVSVSLEQYKSAFAEIDKSVWYIYTPQLKNSTQQARVELIEKQRLELFANRATIKALENSLEIKDRTIKKQSDELEKLGETCGNLVRTKLRNESTIKDLTKRNGNLTRITNDQTERIEVMQHELKNYESAVVSLEGIKDALNKKLDKFEEFNKYLLENETKINESRERLASKFTNWFIFLVFTNVVWIAGVVYQLLTK